MGILINSTDSKSIKQLWLTYHIVAIISSVVGLSIWFSTPFFTRHVRFNSHHQLFRWSSIIIGLGTGGSALYSSIVLAGLEPKIKALEKYETAQFKHSVASELYLARQTNTAIALAVSGERRVELGVEPRNAMEIEGYEDSVDNGTEAVTSEVPVNGTQNEPGTDAIAIALNDGIPDSEIIKNVMGYSGRNYQQGKTKLEEIKQSLSSKHEED